MAVIAANYTDMSAEVVEFKNIGCGQYLSNFAVTVKLNFWLICHYFVLMITVSVIRDVFTVKPFNLAALKLGDFTCKIILANSSCTISVFWYFQIISQFW